MKKALFSLIFIFTGIFSYSLGKAELMDEGIYQIQMGNYWRGKEYLEDYLTLEEDIEAYLYLVEADKKLGNLNRADSIALKASKKYPEDTRPLYERTLIRKLMADKEKTGWKKNKYKKEYYEMFEKYLAKTEYADSDKIFQLGSMYFRDNLYEKANNIFIKEKNHDERNIFGAATTYRFLGEYRKAALLYGKILQVNPEFYEAYLGRGISYQLLGDYGRAAKDFEICLEYKKNINLYTGLANMYINMERYNSAKETLEKAQKDYPGSQDIKRLLIEVYSKIER
ncbi:tetratricopeptide repeat protein [uncultured Ilyobacter sp.]|uniref:tetratricopeptide repeat protein n=1 Tax=uncultured Ilyobacter sp. TaxID=544433 RepID=UPI0029F4929E|nr:tetratricopeptide repeat protein [uncultured Ilyobacter sp.]